MSATDHISVAGVAAVSITLHVPSVGAWWADCALADDSDVSGRVTIEIGDSLRLSGTVRPSRSGAFALQRRVRVVAGADGWSSVIAEQAYHNDGPGGVQALRVVSDAAQAAGETLSAFNPQATSVGKDYSRESGLAVRTLEHAIGSAAWWVDYDGNTNVGTRQTTPATPGTYTVLEYDPNTRVATLAMDDLASVGIGTILAADERLPDAQTVRELRYEISGNDAVVYATCGDTDSRGRILSSLVAIARRALDDKFYGVARYRVIRMNGDRVELQAVTAGLPNIGPISMAPGLAGAHSELAPGSVILVQFVEGNRSMPFIVGFAGKDGTGPTPTNTTIDISALLKLGANASDFVALAPSINSQLDDINQALDAFAAALPVSMDGGAAIHSAFTAKWGPGLPPKEPSNVGSTKVKAE